MQLFRKQYDGESLGQDVMRDLSESLTEKYNKLMSQVPEDDEGFMTGTFTITVSWEQE